MACCLISYSLSKSTTWRAGIRSNQRYALMFSVWRTGLPAKILSGAWSEEGSEGRPEGRESLKSQGRG